jgi:hypothetical protein
MLYDTLKYVIGIHIRVLNIIIILYFIYNLSNNNNK